MKRGTWQNETPPGATTPDDCASASRMNRSNSTHGGNELSSTDPRPRHIRLGIDSDGRHHHYISHTESVYVVDDGDVVHREDLTRHVDEWMAFVDERVGWDEKVYGSFWTHVSEVAQEIDQREEAV